MYMQLNKPPEFQIHENTLIVYNCTDVSIFNILKENPHINTLTSICNVAMNHFGINITEEFGERLAQNKTITSLNLVGNFIGSVEIRIIANALKTNQALSKLDLSDNTIPPKTLQLIANALTSNQTLLELNLDRNPHSNGLIDNENRKSLQNIHMRLERNIRMKMQPAQKFILYAICSSNTILNILPKEIIQYIAFLRVQLEPIFNSINTALNNQHLFFENADRKKYVDILKAKGIFQNPTLTNRFPIQPKLKNNPELKTLYSK